MAQSTRSQQLSSFAGQMPVANQRVADSLQANRIQSMQQAVAQATAVPDRSQIQQAGAQQAQQAGQIQTGEAQANQHGAAQIAQAELAQKAAEQQEQLANRQLSLQKKQQAAVQQLASLDANIKDELWDKQMSFEQDELGRQMFNERQLMDYKMGQAKSEEDWLSFEQDMREASDRRLEMLKTAYGQVHQALSQASQANAQELDQAQRARLVQAKRAIEAKIQKEKARRSNRAAAFQAGGTIVGAVVGGAIGSMAGGVGAVPGAMIGASIGGALGSVAASQADQMDKK